MGCLTAPFRMLGCVGLIAALAVGWLYRDQVLQEGRRLLARVEEARPPDGSAASAAPGAPRGHPGTRALASARAKVDSLNGWRADSVVLTASEVASLMGAGLPPALRRELDSLEVELLEGEVAVHARLRTARLPREVIGPLASALAAREPVVAVGPLKVSGPGTGEWVVRSLRIRDFPVPAAAVSRLVSRARQDPRRESVPWSVPVGVRAVRIRPQGATVYGEPRP